MMTRTLLPAIRCERGDGSTMSLLAVLVGSDVGRSGRAQTGDGLGFHGFSPNFLERLWTV